MSGTRQGMMEFRDRKLFKATDFGRERESLEGSETPGNVLRNFFTQQFLIHSSQFAELDKGEHLTENVKLT